MKKFFFIFYYFTIISLVIDLFFHVGYIILHVDEIILLNAIESNEMIDIILFIAIYLFGIYKGYIK
jgi:hypothetical protein